MKNERKLLCGYRVVDGKWQVIHYVNVTEKKENPLKKWMREVESALYLFPLVADPLDQEIKV